MNSLRLIIQRDLYYLNELASDWSQWDKLIDCGPESCRELAYNVIGWSVKSPRLIHHFRMSLHLIGCIGMSSRLIGLIGASIIVADWPRCTHGVENSTGKNT